MSQKSKGHVKVNVLGHAHMAPGGSDTVHSGEFAHRGQRPAMHKVAKYDHGQGPKDYTSMGRKVAKTGTSQSPKQTYLSTKGTGAGTVNR